MEELDIRYTEPSDEQDLEQWLEDAQMMQWFPFSNEKERKIMAKNWIGFSKYKASLTGVVANKPCAMATLFLMPYKKVSHHAMFYLIVEKKMQRKGIGNSMLKNLLHLAKNYFHLEILHAEVMEGAPIIPLLEKFKFSCFATQDRYFKTKQGYLARKFFERFL